MFRMTVDDVFSIRGRGTVTTGKIAEGALRVGDEVRINDGGPVRVDGIEAFRKILDHAEAGLNVGLLFKDLDRSEVKAGDVVTGAAEPAGVGISTPAPSMPHGRDPRFAQVEAQRAQLLSMRDAGLMTDAQVDEELHALVFTIGDRRWALTAASDGWRSSDGGAWKHDTPPEE